MEVQQFFPMGYDFNQSSTPPSASSETFMKKPSYHYNPNQFNARSVQPPSDGMAQTLAPSAIDTKLDSYNFAAPDSAVFDSAGTPYSDALFQFPSDDQPNFDAFNFGQPMDSMTPNGFNSDIPFPTEAWNTFVNDA